MITVNDVKKTALIVVLGSTALVAQNPPKITPYPITAVPVSAVKVTGGFWAQKMETNRTVTIPHIFDENEQTGRVDNLRKGAGLKDGDYQGRRFNDTDVYKITAICFRRARSIRRSPRRASAPSAGNTRTPGATRPTTRAT